jgi:hypothetical protein
MTKITSFVKLYRPAMGKLFFILLFWLAISSAHAADKEVYKQEAKAFCEVYDPANWKDVPNEMNTVYDELAKRIRKIVVTDEFRNVFQQLADQGYTDFYAAIKPEISKLIGEDWECENAEKFHTITWVKKDSLSEQTANTIDIEITISTEGQLYVNSKLLDSTDVEAIKNAITAQAGVKQPKITIVTQPNTTQETVTLIMDAARQLGVKRLSVLTK